MLLLATLFCSAQKPLLTYHDLQYLIQNPTGATAFLQQKDYRLQSTYNGETAFSGLLADEVYNDVFISTKGKHVNVTLTTNDGGQLDLIQKDLQNYESRSNKNGKIYRIKDAGISNLSVKLPIGNAEKRYSIQLEN